MAEKIEFEIGVSKNDLDKILNDAAKSAKQAEDAMKAFNSALGKNITLSGEGEKTARSMRDAFRDIGKTKISPNGLEKLPEILDKTKTSARESVGFLQGVNNQLTLIKASFLGNLGADVVSGSFRALKSIFSSVVDETRSFSRAIAEINSTLPKTQKLTNDQELALARLSENFGTTPTAQAKGFFEAVSNGIEDTATAFSILKNANNAALSGLVDVNTATQVITTTFNAYKSAGASVAEVTDTLVAVTQASGAKFEEIASSMGRVTNVAAQSGISLGELGGTIAFLNARSLTTEQAITGLAAAVGDISKPTQEAQRAAARLGIDFSASALKAKGLVGFLKEVTDATGGNIEVLRQLFGDQRSANAVIAIATSKFDEYRAAVDKVTASQGEASRAAGVIKKSFDFEFGQLTNSFNELFVSIGQKLAPILPVITANVKAFASTFKTFTPAEPIDALNTNLEKTNAIIEKLQSGSRAGLAALGIDASVLSNEKLNALLQEQLALRDSIGLKVQELSASTGGKAGGGGKPEIAGPDISQETILAREEAFRNLSAARANFDAAEAQLDLDQRTAAGIAQEEDLVRFLEFEQKRIDATFLAEDQKNALILDSKAREQAQLATGLKKDQQIIAAAYKQEVALAKSKSEEEIRLLSVKNNYIQAAANLGTALFKEGSKEAFIVQKAAAIAGIYLDDAKARSAAVAAATAIDIATFGVGGPPYLAKQNALITSNTALASSIVAASAIKGFANGGIIGGATSGPDNRIASVRDGEMVLNAGQQKTLFDAISGGSIGGGEIVINVDGREIARAVRNQITSGFRMAT